MSRFRHARCFTVQMLQKHDERDQKIDKKNFVHLFFKSLLGWRGSVGSYFQCSLLNLRLLIGPTDAQLKLILIDILAGNHFEVEKTLRFQCDTALIITED